MSQLLNEVRSLAMAKFGRPEPGERFAEWVKRFVHFHGKRHPGEMGRRLSTSGRTIWYNERMSIS